VSASLPTREGDQEVPRRPGLNFTLLADEDHAVCELYGTWVEKNRLRAHVLGRAARDVHHRPEGVIAHVIPSASPKTHDEEVLGFLAAPAT
jgi:peroxiredoxin Q/BCP